MQELRFEPIALKNTGGDLTSYHRILDRVEHALPAKLRPLYNHPAGPKTVFFWAPMFKWGLVMAGLADMSRPAEKLSLSQSGVLTATGTTRSRRPQLRQNQPQQKHLLRPSPECCVEKPPLR
ncbi:hypothetical protein CRUP_035902 [Coryphaenoides rupestris]|nr:hypothetical protein CRUP_035902 [Coryphaenoides rupestris]